MRSIAKRAILFALGIAPLPQKHAVLNTVFGWELHPTAKIGLTLFWGVDRLEMGPQASIGHFTVVKGLSLLRIGAHARIGQWNWITIGHRFGESDRRRESGYLLLGQESAITGRHYLDCIGGLEIGSYTTVAGVRTTIITHQIDTESSMQTLRPTSIGSYCFIGSNVCIAPGSKVPDRCTIAMGAVVVGVLPQTDAIYAGVPAKLVRGQVAGDYFNRRSGYVDW